MTRAPSTTHRFGTSATSARDKAQRGLALVSSRRRWRTGAVPRSGRQPGERGSATIEAVVLIPAFLLFVLLIVAGGRLVIARQAVEASAADAARAASIARTAGTARAAATDGAEARLDAQGIHCRSRSVTVDTSGFSRPVGTPARVTATITCSVDLSDIALPGLPGVRTITAAATSPLDTYRARR